MVDYEEEDDYGEDEGEENILKPIQTVDGLSQTMDDDDAEINQSSPTEYAEENIQQSIKQLFVVAVYFHRIVYVKTQLHKYREMTIQQHWRVTKMHKNYLNLFS